MTKRKICVLIAVLSVLALGGQALAHPGGHNTPSPDIPPIIVPGVYLSPGDVHAKYSAGALAIVLQNVEHQPFATLDPTLFECDGPAGGGRCDERHHTDTHLSADVSVNGIPMGTIEMQGPMRTVARDKGPGDTTGTFDVEMIQMNLVGGPGPFMIRESPTRASTGKTSISGPSGGLYHIDSFFDVFTELSLDGGMTWIPNSARNHFRADGTGSTRVFLGGVPEPTSFVLLAIAGLGFMGLARRR